MFRDAEVLTGVSALPRVTRIECLGCDALHGADPQLAQLPGLHRFVLSRELHFEDMTYFRSPPGPVRLPTDMSALSLTLRHLDVGGLRLAQFPLALTQLIKLEHLNAKENAFMELPAGITALSRLTELMLGRLISSRDPLQMYVKRPLDARALGDLSRFPALCKLTLNFCEVMPCSAIVGAAGHASLASLVFCIAHPAPECALAVLQLSLGLWRSSWGNVLKAVSDRLYVGDRPFDVIFNALQDAQGRVPCQMFEADLEVCRLEACGL